MQAVAGQDTSHVTTVYLSHSFCSWPSQVRAEGVHLSTRTAQWKASQVLDAANPPGTWRW